MIEGDPPVTLNIVEVLFGAGSGKYRIGTRDWYPCIEHSRIENVVVLVAGEEEQAVLDDRPAERKSRVVISKGRPPDAVPIVVPGVRIEIIVTVEVKGPPSVPVGSGNG